MQSVSLIRQASDRLGLPDPGWDAPAKGMMRLCKAVRVNGENLLMCKVHNPEAIIATGCEVR